MIGAREIRGKARKSVDGGLTNASLQAKPVVRDHG
jgi:hypothetical protein